MSKSVVAVSRVAVAVLAFTLVVTRGGRVIAGPTPAIKCAAAKIKTSCKKTACLLKLDAGVAAKGGSPDSTKVAKCKSSFASTWGKLLATGSCTCNEPVANVESAIDAFVDDIDANLAPGGPNKCQAAKIKAAAKEVCCEAKAFAKAVVTTGNEEPPDPDTTKCQTKMSDAFSKLETKGGCATGGDAGSIQSKINLFKDDFGEEDPSCDSPSS